MRLAGSGIDCIVLLGFEVDAAWMELGLLLYIDSHILYKKKI